MQYPVICVLILPSSAMALSVWLSFLLAAFLISLSPGPGAFACMASGAAYGWRRAYWTAIGLQGGILFLLALVGAGLGALLAVSPLAFKIAKGIGAGYLAYLGLKLWRTRAIAEGETARVSGLKNRRQ